MHVVRRTRLMEGNRLPSSMPKSAVAEHLKILRRVVRRGGRITDARRKARAFNRHLRDTVDLGRRFDPDQVQERRRQVASMRKLVAQLTSRPDPLGPTYDQRITDAAAVRVLRGAPQRRVGGHGPTMREIRMRFRPTDLVDTCELLGKGLVASIARAMRIPETKRTALLARAIVGCDEHDRARQHGALL